MWSLRCLQRNTFNGWHATSTPSTRHTPGTPNILVRSQSSVARNVISAYLHTSHFVQELLKLWVSVLLRLAPIMLIGLARCTYKFCSCHETEHPTTAPRPPKHHQVEAKLLEQRKPFVPFHKHWWQHCNWSHLLCLALSCRQTEPVSASIVELLWKVKKNVSHLLRRLPLMNLLNVQDF